MTDYNYTVMEKIHITQGNLFWKIVDRLAYRIKRIAKLYEKTVGNEYRKESKKFVLSNSKRILHIGCGSYPITAMTLAEMNNGVKIVAIDNNARAVKRANKVLRRYNLEGKIKAEQGNGTKYPLDGFDTVIISGCSVPKAEVLKHVLKDAKPPSTIIVRSSYFNVESMVDSFNSHHDIKIVDKIGNSPFPTSEWISYYITKNS